MKRSRTGEPVALPIDMALPVRKARREIMSALAGSDVVILEAETGSGKTTQVPQMILESDPSAFVVVTQPRRVAAIAVASRVAMERGVELGGEVGYAVRFDDKSQRGVTNIRYVTDGVLLREALGDGPSGLKKRYSHVIIDEVHERSVNTDLVLGVIRETLTAGTAKDKLPAGGFAAKNEGFAKMIRSKLPFKVVVMSASTDVPKIQKFFRYKTSLKVDVLQVPGRHFPVKTLYATRSTNDVQSNVAQTIKHIRDNFRRPGNILVFLPGQEDIMDTIAKTKALLQSDPNRRARNMKLFPLFAGLSPEDQLRAIEPLPSEEKETSRKAIFSTNIAETSLTLPDVVYVIDTGLVKVRAVIPYKDVYADVLRVERISKAQAEQRKGRAGRTQDGTVFRLYRDEDYKGFEPFPKPEILRLDATSTMLQIIALWKTLQKNKSTKHDEAKPPEPSSSFRGFPLLDNIPQHILARGLETLCVHGATNFNIQLVTKGSLMARFPVPPMLSRSLLESHRVGCVDAMLSLAAVLSIEGNIIMSPYNKRDRAKAAQKRFVSTYGDHLTLVNVFHAFYQLGGTSERIRFCRDHFLNYRSLVSAESIRMQLHDIMRNGDIISWGLQNPLEPEIAAAIEEAGIDELVLRCLTAGYFRNTAKKRESDQKYIPFANRSGSQVFDMGVDIHPGSTIRNRRSKKTPNVLIYDELVITGKAYLRTVSAIEIEWLFQHSAFFAKAKPY